MTREATAAYGSYLAYSVANCYGLSAQARSDDRRFYRTAFCGWLLFEPDPFSDGYSYITPNLTPDQGTGPDCAAGRKKTLLPDLREEEFIREVQCLGYPFQK